MIVLRWTPLWLAKGWRTGWWSGNTPGAAAAAAEAAARDFKAASTGLLAGSPAAGYVSFLAAPPPFFFLKRGKPKALSPSLSPSRGPVVRTQGLLYHSAAPGAASWVVSICPLMKLGAVEQTWCWYKSQGSRWGPVCQCLGGAIGTKPITDGNEQRIAGEKPVTSVCKLVYPDWCTSLPRFGRALLERRCSLRVYCYLLALCC